MSWSLADLTSLLSCHRGGGYQWRSKVAVFAVFTSLALSGCKEEAQWKSKVFVDRTASSVMGEVLVPAELWKRLIDPERPLHDLLN
ncbi:MAG: hypothetical protein JNJ49_10425, partial [Bdellovibrionaceae bacterium]|nr:hypothetical protein [Pseudobdellovibrionaceae bacterium]